MIIGIVALLISLIALTGLTLWATTIIRKMAKQKFNSTREAIKEMSIGG